MKTSATSPAIAVDSIDHYNSIDGKRGGKDDLSLTSNVKREDKNKIKES